MKSIKLFCGLDTRESAGFHAFVESALHNTTMPLQIVPITEWLGVSLGASSDGTNAFSKSRFLVPYLCDYEGWALWMDGSDMLVRHDLADLWALRDKQYALQVVKHDYEPAYKRKYVGTSMEANNEAYPRKNWSSLMLWNCDDPIHARLTPQYLAQTAGPLLHRLSWVDDAKIGELNAEWNWLDEYPKIDKAKIMHYTNGIPAFDHYRGAPFANEWREHIKAGLNGMQYVVQSELA